MWHIIILLGYLERISISFFTVMNSSQRKIVACILLIMLGINFSTAIAGTVNRCESQAGCCCGGIQVAGHEPSPAVDIAGQGCCSSSANIPCNMNKNHVHDAQAFIVSIVKGDLQKADALINVAIGEPSFLQKMTGKSKTNQFWITNDPIPIYLQNLAIIR